MTTAAAAAAAAVLLADFSLAIASLTFFLSGSGSGTSSLTIGTLWEGGGDASFLRAGTNWSRLKLFGAAMPDCGSVAAAAAATTTTAEAPPLLSPVPRECS